MSKIVLSGGGSGGHITPILNCAQALNQLDKSLKLHIVSHQSEISRQLLDGSGWQLHYIQAGKFRRYRGQTALEKLTDFKTWGENLLDLGRAAVGLGQSIKKLRAIKPAVVFVKGGYVGLPVGIAAWLLGIPLVIHESDARAGLTNRLLAHLAKVIATGWPVEYYPQWAHKKLEFTGNIVNDHIHQASQAEAERKFKLKAAGKPVLLAMGGSSGAQAINTAVLGHLDQLLKDYQIIHITGKGDYRHTLEQVKHLEAGAGYRCYDFLSADLKLAYRLADVILSRAGANTLAEIIAVGKPAIIVPHRYSTSAHQQANAAILAEFEAATVLSEQELNKKLMHSLKEISHNDPRTKLMVKNLRRLHVDGSAKRLAELIAGYA